MKQQMDAQGNVTLTFPTGTVVQVPAEKVINDMRHEAIEHAAQVARRTVLVAEPDCGRTCGSHYVHCNCQKCAEMKGFFEAGEQQTYFTEAQRQQIQSLWEDKSGFLGDSGCRLPRNLRAMACLRNICPYDTGLKKYQDLYQKETLDGLIEDKTIIL